MCVCARVCKRRGSPPQSESGEWVAKGQGDVDPGGNRLGQPLSPHSLLCLISDSIVGGGGGVLTTLMLPVYLLLSARAT